MEVIRNRSCLCMLWSGERCPTCPSKLTTSCMFHSAWPEIWSLAHPVLCPPQVRRSFMRLDEKDLVGGRLRLRRIGIDEVACVALLAFFAMQGAIPGIAPNQANEMTNTAATALMKIVGIGSQVLADGAICILI